MSEKSKIIKHYRGLEKDLPTLEEGRLAFTTDTKKMFIGSNDGNVEFINSEKLISEIEKLQIDTNTPSTPSVEIPKYWESHINSKISTIRRLQDEDGTNRFSIGFITDMHINGNNDKQSGKLMSKIDEELRLSLIINGGDCISHHQGAILKSNAIEQIREMFRMFSPRVADKMLYAIANHDDNSHSNQNWNQVLKEGELYSQFFRHLDNNVVRGETTKYYYMDNEFHKTRFIVLDFSDVPYIEVNNKPKYPISAVHAFRQTQLEWFANVALNVPSDDWSVIVTTHAPPYRQGVVGFDRPIINAEIAIGILSAFRNKTTYTGTSLSTVAQDFQLAVSADFTGKGGEVICWLAGDTHRDNIVSMTPLEKSDIHIVTTINDHKNRPSGEPKGISGTITEQAFDIMTVDRANKKVYLTRIGAGVDRQFSYGDVVGAEKGQTIFEDNFTRSDATNLGSNWLAERGEFRISENVARPLNNGGTAIVTYVGNTQKNIILESVVEPIVGSSHGVGLVFRYIDNDNHLRVMIEHNKIELASLENGSKSVIAERPFSYTGTSTYTLRVEVVNEEIKVFIDDILQLRGRSSKFMDSVKFGLRAWSLSSSNSVRYHSFALININGNNSSITPPIINEEMVFNDDFIREDSTSLGENWIARRGQFRIEDNSARPRHTTGTSISLYNGATPLNNYAIESRIQPNISTSTSAGIAFRYVDDDNFVRVLIEGSKLMLVLVDADIKTTLAEKTIVYTGEDRFTIRVEVIGEEIRVFVDGKLELTGSTARFMDMARCGIRGWSQIDDSPRFFGFSISEIEGFSDSIEPVPPIDEGQIIFEDNFTRDDADELGGSWIQEQGQFYIRSNKARSVRAIELGVSEVYSSAVTDVGIQNNISIEASVFTTDAEGILFRYIDEFNYFRIMIENNSILMVRKENDINSVLRSAQNIPQDTVYNLKVELRDDQINILLNEELVLNYGSSRMMTATKCGIRTMSSGTSNGEYSSFIVKRLV